MKKIRLTVLLVLVIAASGINCATIVSGRKQNFTVRSEPLGATVIIDGKKRTTPAVYVLERKRKSYTVRVEKLGYKSVTIELQKGMNGWVWGNIVFGNVIGIIIDYSTGAARKFIPDKIHVDFLNEKIGHKKIINQDVLIVKLVGD